MQEVIGVKSLHLTFTTPKRELLFFDKIAVPFFQVLFPLVIQVLNDDERKQTLYELEWLFSEGLLFEPQYDNNHPLEWDEEFKMCYLDGKKYLDKIEKLSKNKIKNKIIEKELEINFVKLLYIFVRIDCIRLRKSHQVEAFPIISVDDFSYMSNISKKTNVIQIVLNNIPLPDDSVSYEQILDYRADPGVLHL